jgi:hypothetical protein
VSQRCVEFAILNVSDQLGANPLGVRGDFGWDACKW